MAQPDIQIKKEKNNPIKKDVVGNFSNNSLFSKLRDPKTAIAGLMLVILIGVTGVYVVYNRQDESKDNKLSSEYNSFVQDNTDCGEFMKKFSDKKASSAQLSAKILPAQIDCAKNTKQYDRALEYLQELKKVYAADNSLYHYVDIDDETKNIIERKASAANIQQNEGKPEPPIGQQQDGSYAGP